MSKFRTDDGSPWKVGVTGAIEVGLPPNEEFLTRKDLETMLEELDDRMPDPGDTKYYKER